VINKRSQFGRAVPALVASMALVAGGCFHRGGPEPTPPPPKLPVQQVVAPVESPPTPIISGVDVESAEPYIESLIAVDSDVRLVLQKIAEIGKLDLIISGGIRKKISVEYYHVPVSVALKDLLARTGLQLGTGTSAPLPFDTVTVFYRLPANVDSLSADGIMRRFGVSRAIAELTLNQWRHYNTSYEKGPGESPSPFFLIARDAMAAPVPQDASGVSTS
jgi:hypothetical protein